MAIDPVFVPENIRAVFVQAKGVIEWWHESATGVMFGDPRTGVRVEWEQMKEGVQRESRLGAGWVRFDKMTGFELDYRVLGEKDFTDICVWLNGNVASSKRALIFAFLREWRVMREMLKHSVETVKSVAGRLDGRTESLSCGGASPPPRDLLSDSGVDLA